DALPLLPALHLVGAEHLDQFDRAGVLEQPQPGPQVVPARVADVPHGCLAVGWDGRPLKRMGAARASGQGPRPFYRAAAPAPEKNNPEILSAPSAGGHEGGGGAAGPSDHPASSPPPPERPPCSSDDPPCAAPSR